MEQSDFFKRVEQKYLLDERTYQLVRQGLSAHMQPDQYGACHISSIYFDTPDHRMIRSSMSHPAYKEKLRLRCYGTATQQSPVFVEMKKKCQGIVYKRRVEMPLPEAEAYLYHGCRPARDSQILREIDYMRRFYESVTPAVYIGCTRIALCSQEDPELRVTFDWDLKWRDDCLHLTQGQQGQPLLSEEQRLMEVKLSSAMPLWMAELFDNLQVFPTTFSKYGAAYSRSLMDGSLGIRAEIQLPHGGRKGMIICA